MVDPFITPLIALKIALGHAAWARLVLIYKGMLLSAYGHGLAALAHAAITTAQSVGVVGALQMVAQMLLIIGTVGVGSLAAEEAWGALKAMGDGDHAKALKKGRKALKQAGPVLRVWTPSVSGWLRRRERRVQVVGRGPEWSWFGSCSSRIASTRRA
jgi:hypothetical protein